MFGKWVTLTLLAAVLASPALAQEAAKGPFGGFKHDSKAPIEITAESLEVRQADNVAVFAGDVIAGQGTLRLTADKVEVSYDTDQGSNSETGAIQKLVATGKVFLSNGSETAQGASAVYDVVGGLVTMTGDVVLTQGQNAISGQSLTINLNSGTGRIEASPKGRVTTIFKPSTK